jgi:galactokinase
MYEIASGSTHGLADVEAFIKTLNHLDRCATAGVRGLFGPGPMVLARAPGRLDLMGGIADYSGSLVLEMPIREAVMVAVQRRAARRLRIATLTADADRDPVFEMPLEAFESLGRPIEYAAARSMFARSPRTRWAAYVAGVFLVLARECNASFADGASLLIASEVPEGKGVSSSAALEVAAMQAVAAAYGIELDAMTLAVLCQKVENLVVGAPCGIMDQMTAACGQQGRLLSLLCQPAELQGTLAIPPEIEFWGIDSGVRHSVAGADYGSVRVGAFMGYRMIADLAGLQAPGGGAGEPVQVIDPQWGGYLANICPSVFAQRFCDRLPERLSGREFLDRYGGTTDPVTRVDPDRIYAVRNPTAHPIYEHYRVRSFAELLSEGGLGERRLELLGELMYQSHASYSACGLGCEGTDLLVELVRQAGPARGLYGAKITGGGSGGTVAVLARAGSRDAVHEIADAYGCQTGHKPYLFSSSSPGAEAFGAVRLEQIAKA